MNLFKYLPLLLALVVPPLTASAAETLTKPNGKVVLLISGGISRKNQGDVAAFDMAMLSGLPQRSFSTHTPWYPGLTKFSGAAAARCAGRRRRARQIAESGGAE